jgi:hypothetical protein
VLNRTPVRKAGPGNGDDVCGGRAEDEKKKKEKEKERREKTTVERAVDETK